MVKGTYKRMKNKEMLSSFQYGRAYCIKFLSNVGRKIWNKYKWKLYTIIFVLTLMLWAEYMACGTIGEYCLGFE